MAPFFDGYDLRRLNEITRRWTELEHDLISEEEGMTELHHLNQQYSDIHSTIDRWLKQAKDLTQQLTNARTSENFDQLIPKTNRTSEATQKVNPCQAKIYRLFPLNFI